MTTVVDLIEKLGNNISDAEVKNILGESLGSFDKKMKTGGYKYLTGQLGADKLNQIKVRFNSWISNHKNLSGLNSDEYRNFAKTSMRFGDYVNYLKTDQAWRKDTSLAVEAELSRKGFKYAKYLYDENGNLRSEKEFNTLVYGGDYDERTKQEINMVKKLSKVPDPIDALIEASAAARTLAGDPRAYSKYLQRKAELVKKGIQEVKDQSDYKKMLAAAGKAYTNSKVVGKYQLPGIQKYGNLSGTGIFTPSESVMWVNPKGHSPNTARFNEIVQDLDRFDFENTKDFRVSLIGATKTGWDQNATLLESKINRNQLGKEILNLVRGQMSYGKTKMQPFKVSVSPIAADDPSKAAVTIFLDPEFVKENTYTRTKTGKGPGMISPEAADYILANGVTYMMDADQFKNSTYTNAYEDPLAAIVTAKKNYTYADPADPRYNLNIGVSKAGAGDFSISYSYPVYNPNTGETIIDTISNTEEVFGNNLTSAREQVFDYFDKIKQINYSNSIK